MVSRNTENTEADRPISESVAYVLTLGRATWAPRMDITLHEIFHVQRHLKCSRI